MANDFVEECKIMAQAALDVNSAFDRVQATLSVFILVFPIVFLPLALLWAQMRQVSE